MATSPKMRRRVNRARQRRLKRQRLKRKGKNLTDLYHSGIYLGSLEIGKHAQASS